MAQGMQGKDRRDGIMDSRDNSLLFHPDQQDTEGPWENLSTKFTKRTLVAISAPGAGIKHTQGTPSALQHHHMEITVLLTRTSTV